MNHQTLIGSDVCFYGEEKKKYTLANIFEEKETANLGASMSMMIHCSDSSHGGQFIEYE